jgi:putative DNA-invertase from lambdoid prophage Rac
MFHVYARVSGSEQAKDNRISIPDQIQRGRALAHFHGAHNFDVVEHVDIGISGSIPLSKRPAGGQLWADLQPDDTVIAAKLDRMFRSSLDALTMIERFTERKVKLILLDMGSEPVQTSAVATLFFTMLAAFADFERKQINERMLNGRYGKRDRGGHIGGPAPFGYRRDGSGRNAVLVPYADEQVIVSRITNCVRHGRSWGAIQRELYSHGFRARNGKEFQIVQIQRIYEWEKKRGKSVDGGKVLQSSANCAQR